MNTTLREYLSNTDAIHDYIHKFGVAIKPAELELKVKNLHVSIKTIQAVAKRMADVSNIINQLLLSHKPKESPNYINTYPTSNDHAVLRVQDPSEKREIIANIHIPIKSVLTCSEIPVNNIYYIKSLNQYAINVAGVVIKGNLGNIVPYQTQKSARCQYGIKCTSFSKHIKCTYYHDPEDFIFHNMPIPNDTRNYTVGSWLYSSNKQSKKTYFTRHIGNLATMQYDLAMLRHIQYREEVSNREGQLIHDLLTYMILHNKGMLERYPHWKK